MSRTKKVLAATGAFMLLGVAPALATVVNVGGGTWNYGTTQDWTGLKKCYSHYVHPTHQHTATAIIHDQNVKVSRAPGTWANADARDGWIYTCYAYWNTL